MQYTAVKFLFSFAEDYQQDLFLQGLADMGFESFTDDSAYIQTTLFDEEQLRLYAAENSQTILSIDAIADQNWNEAWEQEHPLQELPMGVRIIPHCAFGAGHHETTGMMIDELMLRGEPLLKGQQVLDNGCGTGVLGIFAAKMGAMVHAVDIDDKSVLNTQENAALNNVNLTVSLGSTPKEGVYQLILSNIHRNILLAQMPLYAQYLTSNGELWLSGFYAEDIQPLTESANAVGLQLIKTNSRGDWQMMILKKC